MFSQDQVLFTRFVKYVYYISKTHGFTRGDVFSIDSVFEKFRDVQDRKVMRLNEIQNGRGSYTNGVNGDGAPSMKGSSVAPSAEDDGSSIVRSESQLEAAEKKTKNRPRTERIKLLVENMHLEFASSKLIEIYPNLDSILQWLGYPASELNADQIRN